MPTFLFESVIFGPVSSRRMGVSLGINLLPVHEKFCNFNCVYCECGFTPKVQANISSYLPSKQTVVEQLTQKLSTMNPLPDSITFAGNGEPTIHPDFVSIITEVIEIRNTLAPKAQIVVLTNATQLHKSHILEALQKVDKCMFKLDSAIIDTLTIINQPQNKSSIEGFVSNILKFKGKKIIQTMFVRGSFNGKTFDNTTPEEIEALIQCYEKIQPHSIVVYGIQRDTPIQSISKVPLHELEEIGNKIKQKGFNVTVSY